MGHISQAQTLKSRFHDPARAGHNTNPVAEASWQPHKARRFLLLGRMKHSSRLLEPHGKAPTATAISLQDRVLLEALGIESSSTGFFAGQGLGGGGGEESELRGFTLFLDDDTAASPQGAPAVAWRETTPDLVKTAVCDPVWRRLAAAAVVVAASSIEVTDDGDTGAMVLWVCAALPPRCEHGRDADDDADGDADDDECDEDEDEDHADDDEDDGPPVCVRAARRLRCYVGGSGRFCPLCMH